MRTSALPLVAAMLLALPCGPLPARADDGEREPAGLAQLLRGDEDAGFVRAFEPRRFAFPADHGPHPRFRNEWWYLTGNLDGDGGERFGYELTIFRFALTPEAPAADSAWRTNQVYIAHFALTDAATESFYAAERFSRGAAGLAGAQAEPLRVWIDDWEIAAGARAGSWRLAAADGDVSAELELTPLKPPVLNGVDGLSQKSAEPGNASYYYSMPRWDTQGKVAVGGRQHAVAGLSWLDREWSSSALGRDQQGWDWFALQLDDGSDLMFYQLRNADGGKDVHSAGTWMPADGRPLKLGADAATIEVLDTWESPAGGRYPSRWRVSVPSVALELVVEPVIADQELFTVVRYWEGAVDVSGRRAGRPVAGRGYVELTGYADADAAR